MQNANYINCIKYRTNSQKLIAFTLDSIKIRRRYQRFNRRWKRVHT